MHALSNLHYLGVGDRCYRLLCDKWDAGNVSGKQFGKCSSTVAVLGCLYLNLARHHLLLQLHGKDGFGAQAISIGR